MKKVDYVSPSSEILLLETSGCLLSSSAQEPIKKQDMAVPANETISKPSAQVKKAGAGKLVVVAARPNVLFSKVKVSIDDEVVAEIREKGQFIIPIAKDCEVKFRWQLLPGKYISASANEVKIVKLSYTQSNIKLSEKVYARDGVKVVEDTSESKSNAGLKAAGVVALGVLAALAGADDGFDGDFDLDDDLDLDLDGDGIADSIGVDYDGDGVIDTIATDTDGDGILDTFTMDSDGDGNFDTIVVDSDGDGVLDSIGQDTNADGVLDTFAADTNADGEIDQIARDTNYDGVLDAVAVDADLDGTLDVAGVDVDGDGTIDVVTHVK